MNKYIKEKKFIASVNIAPDAYGFCVSPLPNKINAKIRMKRGKKKAYTRIDAMAVISL